MTDRPILFSAPMIRALLDGRKTQTRRIIKPQPYPLEGRPGYWNASGAVGGRICVSDRALLDIHRKPKPGDRLYVREHWRTSGSLDSIAPRELPRTAAVLFNADGDRPVWAGKHRQAMHMPRWASRLTLIVTDVRVERLTGISDDDAKAEGVLPAPNNPGWWLSQTDGELCPTARDAYADLWNAINGEGAWQANPWVAAYTFTVERGNIDQVRRAA